MGIPKLPLPVSVFRNSRKVSDLIQPFPLLVYLNFAIRRSHDRELGRERINSQVTIPLEFDVFYSACELLNTGGCCRAIRKY